MGRLVKTLLLMHQPLVKSILPDFHPEHFEFTSGTDRDARINMNTVFFVLNDINISSAEDSNTMSRDCKPNHEGASKTISSAQL